MSTIRRSAPFAKHHAGSGQSGISPVVPMVWSSCEPRAVSSGLPRRRSRVRSMPSLEIMGERVLLSSIPVFETANVVNGSNPTVLIAPMEQTVLQGRFTSTNTDRVNVHLQAGEILTAGLSVLYPGLNTNYGSSIEVYGPNGSQVAAQTTSILAGQLGTDPTSGVSTYNANVAFEAASTGSYTIEVDENAFIANFLTGPGTYALTLRPVGLDTSTLTPDSRRRMPRSSRIPAADCTPSWTRPAIR